MPSFGAPSRPVLDAFQTLLVTIVLVFTRQTSIFRYLSVPILTAILYLQITQTPAVAESFNQWLQQSPVPFNYFHQINLLTITSIDFQNDNNGVLPGLWERLKRAFIYQGNARGIGTVHQIKNIPPIPGFYYKKKKNGYLSPKYRFVVRQLCLSVWQYLVVDVGCSLWHRLSDHDRSALFGPGTEWTIFNAEAQDWKIRVIAVFLFLMTVRNALDLPHRLGSAMLTTVGVTSVHDWPPMWGSLWDVHTLRNFWGKWWHQQMRWTLSSHSNLITRRVLKLPRRSLLERYLNNAIVHGFSTIVHVNGWRLAGLHDGYIGCSLFYMSFVGGYMIEDFVQYVWFRLKRSYNSNDGRSTNPLLFEKFIGALWVGLFLTVTTPWWIYPLLRRYSYVLPLSFVGTFGMNNVLAVIGIGALILKTQFDADI